MTWYAQDKPVLDDCFDCVVIDLTYTDISSVQALRDYIESVIAEVPPEYQASAYVHTTQYGTYLEWQVSP